MSRENHMRSRSAHPLREQLHEAGIVVPALHEDELGAPVERFLEPAPVVADREARVVRGEHEADQSRRTLGECLLDSIGDPRLPVLHPGVDGELERLLERRACLLRDRIQRRAVVASDAEPPVALDEVLEQLGPDRVAAADVGVVGGDVFQALRRPVGHQDDRRAHRPTSGL